MPDYARPRGEARTVGLAKSNGRIGENAQYGGRETISISAFVGRSPYTGIAPAPLNVRPLVRSFGEIGRPSGSTRRASR